MAKIWEVAPRKFENLIEQFLYNRGLKTAQQKEKFFHPDLADFESELNLTGIKAAAKIIKEVISRGELIIVFGDYDADGLCGAAVLYLGLTQIGAKVLPYIPHREKEGYGLSKTGIDFARDQGAALIITVDNGIAALEAAEYAKSLGLELIVTDHHTPAKTKPEAAAIVHSTRMCGAAVGWCLVRQLVDEDQSTKLLDLVAVATITDLLPLTGLNRALVVAGLRVLNETNRVGLLSLIKMADLTPGVVNAFQVSHVIGPRLNAIGRLEHAMDSLRLLCTKDLAKASRLAAVLCNANDQKKKIASQAVIEASQLLRTEYEDGLVKEKILILHSKEWIPGIIGLLAGRLAEEYLLPAVVISEGEIFSKGSARTVGGVNVVEVIRQCSNSLLEVGGHPGAAGFTLESSKIPLFKKELQEAMKQVSFDPNQTLYVEALVPASDINNQLIEDLQKLEPTGVDNPAPVLASYNVRLSDLKTVGNGGHLKFKADNIEAIGFGFGKMASLLREGSLVNLAYQPEINRFNGRETIQLKVIDIQLT